MIPLVEPPELEPVLAEAKERSRVRGPHGRVHVGRGRPGQRDRGSGQGPRGRLIVIGSTTTACSHGSSADVAAQVKRDAGCDVIVAD